MMLDDCIACQYGDHDGHREVIQAVPKGVMGGARCPCTGDCRERNGTGPAALARATAASVTELIRRSSPKDDDG